MHLSRPRVSVKCQLRLQRGQRHTYGAEYNTREGVPQNKLENASDNQQASSKKDDSTTICFVSVLGISLMSSIGLLRERNAIPPGSPPTH